MLLQIIINRIALLMVPASRAAKVRWSVAAIVGAINLSGFFIWIPARLQISPVYEEINIIWDRSEKGVFLAVDLSLNLYFIYLVRSRLITNGLTKYNRLFHFNIGMVIISVVLDVVLIGATFLPSPVVYLQFHPLTYLMKLYIEMNVASLIVKVVRDTSVRGGHTARGQAQNTGHYYRTGDHDGATNNKVATYITANRTRHDTGIGVGTSDSGSAENEGIRKTVETHIVHGKAEDDGVSETSSTTNVLREGPFYRS
ncbi:glutathione s-transferase [Apiospora rasikravindrae]|uniref:Glutathione s-transferase n=1 Tax=Apiospora rasikravindrae TaxID=990691 RepID=A0ABR1TZZ5_9PEZI